MPEEKKTEPEKNVSPPALSTVLLLAVLGHLAFQFWGFPQFEAAIPFAVLAGLWYGGLAGAFVGAVAYLVGNFFLAGAGIAPQIFFESAFGAIAGGLGRFAKKENYALIVIAATLLFEIGVALFGTGFVFRSAGLTEKIPWIISHVVTNAIIAIALQFWFFREK